MSYVENNLMKDEKIVSKAEVNMVAIVPTVIEAILVVIVAFVIADMIWFDALKGIAIAAAAIFVIAKFLKIKNTELAVTNKKIIGKTGLINTKVMDSPINKINNISVEQGFGGKIFGYGKIVVSTSSGAYEFEYIKNADTFRHSVMNEIDRADEERVQKQAQELANAMRQ